MTADVVLRDGSTLHLRPARAGDRAGLADFRARMADADRLLLFADLANPDTFREVVLVGEVGDRIEALAGYRRSADRPDHAEVALVVAPMLEGRGIGTRLLEILADEARANGVTTFDAWVLGSQPGLLDLFVSSGFDVLERFEAGRRIVSLSIAETPRYLERTAARAQEAATASMRAFFAPRSVAVVGANHERGRIGSEVLHNLRAAGFVGDIYPIHPNGGTIDGLQAYPRLVDVPGPVDLAVVIVPAAAVLSVVDDGLAKGVKAFVVISAGFSEVGGEGRAREAAIVDRVRRAGVRLIGPNCMGILNTDPAVRLDATFSPVYPPAGRVAMSTQSGALGLAILDYASRLNIGISTFVSVGNKADVSGNDLMQYWAEDPRTDVILLYTESFGNPRKFSEIARRIART
jgi:succinyl-CoA synthetase alpha subunit/GNAT superfamily N-acetyltransferase